MASVQPGTLVEITEKNFSQVLKNNEIVLIDCWAPWCGPCRDFKPVFEETAADYSDVTFASLNTNDEADLTKKLGVSHVPSLTLFREGILLFKQPGYFDRNGLADIISQAKSLDMDQVRTEIEAQNTPER